MSAIMGSAASSRIEINAEGWFARNDCLQMYPEMKGFFSQFPEEYRFKVDKNMVHAMLPWVSTMSVERALTDEEFSSIPVLIQVVCLTSMVSEASKILQTLREDFDDEDQKGS